MLRHIDKNGVGLEIGPSHSPVAPKRSGFKVDILDHLNREQLVEKYLAHDVSLESIEDVDFVWSGEPYLELTGKPSHYDWIIASHVIEHTPDLIRFFHDCHSILKRDGVLSLAIPDKRYCFDYFRPLTGLAKVIDAHFYSHSIHSPGSAAEYFMNVVSKGKKIAWSKGSTGDFEFVHTLEDAIGATKSVVEDNAYLDVHAWCFTPHSFRLLLNDLYHLGYSPFQEMAFHEASGCEFFVTLNKQGNETRISRLDLLNKIQAELAQPLWEQLQASTHNTTTRDWLDKIVKWLSTKP